MRDRPRAWFLGLMAVILVGLVLLTAVLVYNTDYLKLLLLQQVERQLGRRIEVGEARLDLFPRLRLELAHVVVRDLDPSQVMFSAERMELVLRAIPLLRQQVLGKRLTIDQPKLVLRRDPQGNWNFSGGPPSEAGAGNPLNLVLMVKESVIRSGEVTVLDEFRPDGVRHLKVASLDTTISVAVQGDRADVGISAVILAPHAGSAVSLVGTVTQSPVLIGSSAGTYGPQVQFDGQAEALNVDLAQLADFFGPRPVPVGISGAANIRGHIRVIPGVAGYDMVLSDMAANLEGLKIGGHASLSGLLAAAPTVAVTFATSALTLEELLSRVSLERLYPDLFRVVQEREIGGTIEVVTATLTGSAAPEPHLSLTGEIRVSDGQARIGEPEVPIQELAGTVFVEPQRIRFTEVSGRYGAMEVTGGKGAISFLEEQPKLELEVTGEMSAADLVGTLTRDLDLPAITPPLSALKGVGGRTTLTLRLGGRLGEPGGVEFLGGDVVLQDVSFLSPSVPERVTNLTGRLLVSPQSIELERIGARMGASRVALRGAIALGEKSRMQSLTLHAALNTAQWLPLLPDEVASTLNPDGTLDAQVEVSGAWDRPQFKATVNLQDVRFTLPGGLQKAAGVAAKVIVEGGMGASSVLNIDRLELAMPPLQLAGKGKLRLEKNLPFEATLVSGPITLNDLSQGGGFFGLQDGTLEVSLELRGTRARWQTWRITGWVALTDAVLRTKEMPDPVTNLYLRLKLVRNGADLKRLALRYRGNELHASGAVRQWHRIPTAELKIESSQFDLDLLVPKGERSVARDILERLAAGSRVVANVTLDRGVYREFDLKEVSCRVNIRDGVLDIDRITAQSQGGSLAGRLILHLPVQGPAEAEVAVRILNFPFEEFGHLFGTTEHPVVGTMTLTGTLRGREKGTGGMLSTLNGALDLAVKQGRILKLTILSKILTILNLPVLLQGKVNLAKDGMPFEKLTANFSIQEGTVVTENLLVDSPVMKMTAAGRYHIPEDRLDVVMAVSPFGSYSQLLKSIPLFGKLFAGERKGLDTALFAIKGPIKDPDVNYLSLRSFATGLTGLAQLAIDVLKNVLMLPKDLVTPDESPPPAQPSEPSVPTLSTPEQPDAPSGGAPPASP